jgi:hypothetical protein
MFYPLLLLLIYCVNCNIVITMHDNDSFICKKYNGNSANNVTLMCACHNNMNDHKVFLFMFVVIIALGPVLVIFPLLKWSTTWTEKKCRECGDARCDCWVVKCPTCRQDCNYFGGQTVFTSDICIICYNGQANWVLLCGHVFCTNCLIKLRQYDIL